MKALRFAQFGKADVLKIEEIPDPTPVVSEVLIQIKAAAINPSDVKNVSGHFHGTTLPRTPGRDFAGVIASGDQQGKRVWGTVPGMGVTRDGTHAQYVAVPAAAVNAIPKNLSFEQAATIGVPYTTAWAAVVDAGQIRAGQTILIIGASGAVGQAATQIANWSGARVIGGERGNRKTEGAVASVDTTGDLSAQVKAITDGSGVDAVFDTVGGSIFESGLKCLCPGGRYVIISSTGERRVSFDLIDFYHNQSHLVGVDSQAMLLDQLSKIAARLNAGFSTGALHIGAVESVPFERAVDAYRAIEEKRSRAKTVLVM